MDSKLIIVVFGVIAMALGRSEAITCYSCDSVTQSKCMDPFNSDGVGTCQGATCIKGWNSRSGVTVVQRGCNPIAVESDQCVDVTTSGATAKGCYCRTDYCNDGQMVKPSPYNVMIGVAMATVMAIVWMNQI